MLLSLAVVFTRPSCWACCFGVLYARLPISAVELDSAWSTTTSNTTVAHRHRCGSGVGGAVAGRRGIAEAVSTKALGDGSNTALTRVRQVAAAGAALVAVATFVIPWAMRASVSGAAGQCCRVAAPVRRSCC